MSKPEEFEICWTYERKCDSDSYDNLIITVKNIESDSCILYGFSDFMEFLFNCIIKPKNEYIRELEEKLDNIWGCDSLYNDTFGDD